MSRNPNVEALRSLLLDAEVQAGFEVSSHTDREWPITGLAEWLAAHGVLAVEALSMEQADALSQEIAPRDVGWMSEQVQPALARIARGEE